jgi:hypothetical protein
MPIKFDCPHCKKTINAKDHLAGKNVKCPACKQPLTVPAPVSAPADVDELAMSLLGEKPAEQAAEEAGKPIEFPCPMCDEPVSVSADLSGKQTPCPHCRRIVKVPVQAKQQPKDWRQAQTTGPSAALQNQEVAPEGAWGTTTSRAQVHKESLEEAGALPEEKERLSVSQWIVRGVVLGTVVLLAGFGIWSLCSAVVRNREGQTIDQVLAAAKDLRDKKREAAGELYRAVGEFQLRRNTHGCALQAQAHFHQAREQLAQSTASERDPLLIELALVQTELGGSGPEVDNDLRINWVRAAKGKVGKPLPGVDQELQQTLEQLRAPEARLAAVRELSRKLSAKGKAALAAGLAAALVPDNDLRAEAAALAGLEMWRADPATAEAEANQALGMLAPAAQGGKPPVSPALLALCLALNKPELLGRLPAEWRPGAPSDNSTAVLLGHIEGQALQGNAVAARQLIGKLSAGDRWQGSLAAASGLAAQQPEEARKDLEEASRELQQHGRVPPWVALRLIQLGQRTGLAQEHLQSLPAGIQDPGLRSWAQLEVLRTRLAANKATKAADDWVDGVDKETAAASVARETLARHNARVDGGTLSAVQQWPEEYRPFGIIGALLGRQDGQ